MAGASDPSPFLDRYGPWAVVTGASSGIGAEFARQLAARGMHLVMIARRGHRLEELGARLTDQYSVKVKAVPVDLAAPDFMERIDGAVDGVDVGLLVNNAGFGVAGPFLEGNLRRELELLDVNCRAPLILTHVLGRKMVERGRGGVVFVSSVVGFLATPFMSHYSASKAYGLLLGEGLGFELKRFGVDVLVLCPGGTETEFQDVAGVRPISSMKVEPVVSQALHALGRKNVVIAGLRNRVLIGSIRLAPRWVMTNVLGSVFERLGRHEKRG